MPSKIKSKSKGARKLKKATPRPKYSDMIVAAITAMQERGGTSTYKILKYIGANYKVGRGFEVHARLALKKLVQAGSLVCTKGSGASGFYKLAATKKVAIKTTKRRRRSAKRSSRSGAAKKAGRRRKSSKRKAASKKRSTSKRKGSAGRKRSATRKPKTSAKKPRTTLRRRLPRRRCTKK